MADREAYINGVTFGEGRSFVLESVELPQNEYRTQDTENPVGDGMIFGRDRITPGSLTLNILVLGEDSAEVNANLRDLSRAWYRAGDRTKPGNITSMWWEDGGRRRLVYGRPRSFAVVNEHSRQGLIRVTAEFKLADHLTYDNTTARRRVTVTGVPPISGGLVAPLVEPLTASGWAARPGLVEDTGGDAPTPFQVKFYGPISSPFVKAKGWSIKLNTTLAWDEVITVDTRLGTVTSNLGRNMKPFLDPKSRLRDAKLATGSTEFEFGGVDATKTAYVEILWYPAFYI